jgi:hypothetical protein
VSAGDPVQDITIQPAAPDTPSTAAPTDEPQDYQQPKPPIASGRNDEDALTEDPVSAPSTSPQLPPASSRPMRDRRPPDRRNLYSIFHMTAKRALREDPATTRPAIEAECTLIGWNTPLPIRVLSSASIAGHAVAGSSRSALFAVMWKTLYRLHLSGRRRSLIGRDDAGGSCGEVEGAETGSSVSASSLLWPEAMEGLGCW